MSRLQPSRTEQIQLEYHCPRCHATPGRWCTTVNDGYAQMLHASRQQVARTRRREFVLGQEARVISLPRP